MGTAPRNKKTGASPRNSTRSSTVSAGSKSWLWLLTGFLLGAGSVALWHIDTHPNQPRNIVCSPDGAPPASSSSAPQGDEPAPHFDFYSLLPGQPAITSSSTQAQENQPVSHAPLPPEKSPERVAMDSTQALSHATSHAPGTYLLQCGSFATTAEADSRRAAMIMLGFNAEIHPAKITHSPARYRVMVGPFADHQRAMAISHQLSQHQLACIIVKKT